MGFKLRSGNGPLKFKEMGSSPVKKGIFGDDVISKMPTKEVEKLDNETKEPNLEKATPPTPKKKSVSKKVKKFLKDKKNEIVDNIQQRRSDKKLVKAKTIAAADTPEKRLALRKQKRKTIADNLEYIFLDGKRPDERQAQREAQKLEDEERRARLDKYHNSQNENVEYDPEDENTKGDTKEDTYKPSEITNIATDPEKKIKVEEDPDYKNRGKQYKNYSHDQYVKEKKRQQGIFEKTGKWDHKGAPKY
jgi:hypothetical protein